MNDQPKVDHMADWKALGHSASGIRKAMARMYHQQGLESYLTYSLDEAAARIEQLEAALMAAGVTVPEPSEPDKIARAIAMAEVMVGQQYTGRDIAGFVWSQWGSAAKAAVIKHFTEKEDPGHE